jgi:HSP20 family protein
MKSLVQRKPKEELVPRNLWQNLWGEDFDAVWEGFVGPMAENEMGWMPKVEAYRNNGSYVLKAHLPGVKAKDIHVTVDNGCLVIRGERQEQQEVKRKAVQKKEVYYGRFERAMAIPDGLEVEKMKAEYHDGVLEITAPMEKAHPPKEVKVEAGKGV